MGEPTDQSAPKRILWLHTQPEHYFNCMMDDLARGTGYAVPGMPALGPMERFQYVAAFAARGPGWYKENAQPSVCETVFLKPLPGKEERVPGFRERYHADWRADLLPLKFDAAIVSGYAWRTQREVMHECRRRGIPVVLWSDSNLRSERGVGGVGGLKSRVCRALKKRFLGSILGSVDHLMTANRLGVAYWRYYGAPRGKITVCPYYADYARIDAARCVERADVCKSIGIASSDRIVLSAARLVPAKGLELMINAFVAGGFGKHGWKYIIAGMGPLEAELKQLAARDPNGSVRFIGFQQPTANLALMAQAELLALPSRYEPHGIVVAEALAAGTPVLASDIVGAAHDLVEHGTNGVIFRSDDARDLARKLKETLDGSARLSRMRAAARPAFEEWYRRTSPTRVVPTTMARLLGVPH